MDSVNVGNSSCAGPVVSLEGPEDSNFSFLLILKRPLTHPHALQKLPHDSSNMSPVKSMSLNEKMCDERYRKVCIEQVQDVASAGT